MLSNLFETIFPSSYEAIPPRATSYEDVHGEVQSILLPPTYAKGVSLYVLQSLNKSFALQHKVNLEPGVMQRTMMGPRQGPGKRYYSVGAIVTHVTPGGGKHRVSAQYDPENAVGKSTFLSDVWGDGRLRLLGQLHDDKSEGHGPDWGLTATLRGEDYVAITRAKNGKEAGLSYSQRLAPGSPVTMGGELFFNLRHLRTSAKPTGIEGSGPNAGKPLEWALGGAYDTGAFKTAVHLATAGNFKNILSVHHLARVSDRSSLAAKFMTTPATGASMFSVGYRLKFRNTLSVIHGVVDSYGTVRVVMEREPIKDLKIGASMDARIGPHSTPTADGLVTFGFRMAIGSQSPITAPLSPCTMTRDIFAAT